MPGRGAQSEVSRDVFGGDDAEVELIGGSEVARAWSGVLGENDDAEAEVMGQGACAVKHEGEVKASRLTMGHKTWIRPDLGSDGGMGSEVTRAGTRGARLGETMQWQRSWKGSEVVEGTERCSWGDLRRGGEGHGAGGACTVEREGEAETW